MDGAAESVAAGRSSDLVLVFDGDCRMCAGFAGRIESLGLAPDGGTCALQRLPDDTAAELLAGGVRDEMAVVDRATGEARYGLDAFAWVWGSSLIGRVLLCGPLVRPLRAVYRMIAYNRRYLSTPAARAIRCDCDPAPRPGYQGALAVGAVLFAAGALLLLGAAAPPEVRLAGSRLGAAGPLVKAGWPWVLIALIALTLERPQRGPYLVHLAVTAAVGALLPALLAVCALASPETFARSFETLLQIVCVVSFLAMAAMQRRRVAYERLKVGWLVGWSVGAAFGLFTLGWLHTLG